MADRFDLPASWQEPEGMGDGSSAFDPAGAPPRFSRQGPEPGPPSAGPAAPYLAAGAVALAYAPEVRIIQGDAWQAMQSPRRPPRTSRQNLVQGLVLSALGLGLLAALIGGAHYILSCFGFG